MYNSFIRDIGIPYSKEIRDRSKIRSQQKSSLDFNGLLEKARDIINNGYIADAQRAAIISSLANNQFMKERKCAEEITELISRMLNSKHVLELNNGRLSRQTYDLYTNMFEFIYQEMESKLAAERLISKICHNITNGKT